MKAHKWRTVKIHILSQQIVFFPFVFYYHISKSVLPDTFQKWRFLLSFWQPRTSPFHITHRTLIVNQQSSHGKPDVPRSGEQLRCSEMRHVCSSWGCCLISPHSPCQGLTLLIDSCTAELCSHMYILSGLCWQRGCWCWMSRGVEPMENLWSSRCCLSAGRASTSPCLQTVLRHSQAQPGEMQQAEVCGCWGKRVPWSAAHPISELGKLCCRWCWQSLPVTSADLTHL